FIRAVEETALEHGGLPSQLHVKRRCEKLDMLGDWRDRRDKLGFGWLPPQRDWERHWKGAKRFGSQHEVS
ncbi:hypothetical protein N9Z83_02595, partial [Akkermansiaceae bacterium]|nr:hypothetical protein [Akkermansiaceae bacterium]